MPFISSSEAKNAYFMSGFEIYIFSLLNFTEINGIFMTKKLNFLFIIYTFKRDRFFALNDVKHIHTSRHINDDVA